ncbi:SDR family oxidoreductase [Diaminobutyricibacter tongyongensis]|uniref:SDR family oxidoreductase n=1 Tax=Leifsonia tongyongensis TaxID=1268043 RepID=A0A6L9XXB0_9MICO|nr:SDR family oxidoreductase [Diaminobutyricibacter tongyongensis]NEN05926.1 SDR family oxidoreductase [Diaminobutyricibacter tongyongensis]
MLLDNKIAVVYGAGGAIGSAVARAFAAEGADVFVTGRVLAPVERVARDIAAAGGSAHAAEVDALDERAIDVHLRSVVDAAGRVDISFNAVGVPTSTLLGVPLADLDAESFVRPITAYTTSYFLTARLAARRMLSRASGVIMTVSALPARTGTRLNGGYGPAQAAKEAMTRDLSAEFAPAGIRVVGIRPHGIPETETMRHSYESKPPGMTWEEFEGWLEGMTHPRRTMTIDEVANVAAFVASDRASGLTGTIVNLTMGSLDD